MPGALESLRYQVALCCHMYSEERYVSQNFLLVLPRYGYVSGKVEGAKSRYKSCEGEASVIAEGFEVSILALLPTRMEHVLDFETLSLCYKKFVKGEYPFPCVRVRPTRESDTGKLIGRFQAARPRTASFSGLQSRESARIRPRRINPPVSLITGAKC